MVRASRTLITAMTLLLVSCGGLETKSNMINLGDGKDRVLNIMGPPDDRQFKGSNEAWQYCHAKTGIGIHDYRIIWLYNGKVTGMNSYKNPQPVWGCMKGIRPVRWEDAPNETMEIRIR